MNALGRDGVVDLDLAFDEREPDRNRLHAADALVLTDPERALREYQDLANLGSAMSTTLRLMYERGRAQLSMFPNHLNTTLWRLKKDQFSLWRLKKGSVRATFGLKKPT